MDNSDAAAVLTSRLHRNTQRSLNPSVMYQYVQTMRLTTHHCNQAGRWDGGMEATEPRSFEDGREPCLNPE